MVELLSRVLDSHGGLPNWDEVDGLTAEMSLGGPERVEIRTSDGRVVEERENPRPGFPAFAPGVAWDAVQVAYFTSCATWNYLTAPFSFSYPGVTAHEIEPWNEDGQEWR